MKIKKILALSLSTVVLFSSSVFAQAQQIDKVSVKIKLPTDSTISVGEPVYESAEKDVQVKRKLPNETFKAFYVGEPVYEHENPAVRLASIDVDVTSPCDDEWRNAYSNYAYQANRAVERADDELYSEFGIDFYSVSQPIWSSSSTTSEALLEEAFDEHGLTYDDTETADIMIAFSGETPSDDSSITGVTYFSYPYSTIFDNGYSMNAETTQHEAGHMYALNHCEDESGSEYDGSNCVMTEAGFGHIGDFCDGHYDDWENNADWY